MNFNAAYDIIGKVPESLLEEVNKQISIAITDDDFTYKDRDVKNKQYSWLRLDFMSPADWQDKQPLYKSITDIIEYVQNNHGIDPLSSVSLSMLKPKQILDEHTDGRFFHRITNRYLVPLMKSDKNYMYGYYNNQKVVYKMTYGNVYRINNAIIHSAINDEDAERFNILIDTIDPRLKEKFITHPDVWGAIAVLGVNSKFEKRRAVKPDVL